MSVENPLFDNQPFRTAFFVSDSTCITAQNLGRSLLSQFGSISFKQISLRFVNSYDRATAAMEQIKRTYTEQGVKPLVFSTLTSEDLRTIVSNAPCEFFDLFEIFVKTMERSLGTKSVPTSGHSHGIVNREEYFERMEAVNFTITHDDGGNISQLEEADIIMIGISRSGKTPTCLDLSLNYSLRAANYPLDDENLESLTLPKELLAHKDKLFGLTTSVTRLFNIRSERIPNSRYASVSQCSYEIRQAERLMKRHNIPFLNSENMSIEEAAASIMDKIQQTPKNTPLDKKEMT